MRPSDLKQKAYELGFSFAGVIPAEPSPYLSAYHAWIDSGMHGSMGYLARPDRIERRDDLNVILPGVRSLIMVGLDYRAQLPADLDLTDPSRGRIASYAWGLDYHDIMLPRLDALAEWIAEQNGHAHRSYVDTGAILERSHAQRAGLGFIGKNTMLIHLRRGSYFFLGEILTTLEFSDYDMPLTPPGRDSLCGSCTRCLAACPTNAFPRPYVLDARRCISYLTIEHKGWIERELRPLMGNWVYGCDVCQEVCPWQRFTLPTNESAFIPVDSDGRCIADRVAPSLIDLLQMDEAHFKQQFAGSAIIRIKRDRLVRNACIAAGNWGDESAVQHLIRLLDDPSPLVRGHAAWGLHRIMGEDALRLLSELEGRETDKDVLEEIDILYFNV
jgi:epoxyqueuosine reductase